MHPNRFPPPPEACIDGALHLASMYMGGADGVLNFHKESETLRGWQPMLPVIAENTPARKGLYDQTRAEIEQALTEICTQAIIEHFPSLGTGHLQFTNWYAKPFGVLNCQYEIYHLPFSK